MSKADEIRADVPAARTATRRAPSARELSLRAELLHVRHELSELLAALDQLASEAPERAQSAVVTAVVERTSLLFRDDTQSD
jgi:hypothetical protein